jgi:integrase
MSESNLVVETKPFGSFKAPNGGSPRKSETKMPQSVEQTGSGSTLNKHRIVSLVGQLLIELGVKLDGSTGNALRQVVKNISPYDHPIPKVLTISDLCKAYMTYAESYYLSRNGKDPHEAISIGYALRPLRRLFGRSDAAEFGPRSLKEVREAMVAKGWCRSHVNMQTGRVKRMFKWAVSNEMIPATVFHSLQSVDGLRSGRTKAPESKPVKPVPEEMVEAVLPHVSSPVRAMVRLQLLTGMRPGEVTIMRSCDVDRSCNPWRYRPEHHKTEQHGHERVIILGPKAQEILQPFIDGKKSTAYLFAPCDSDKERRRKLSVERKTPMSCGNKPGSNRKGNPMRKPGERYDTQAYGHAIRYGCRAAFPPPEGLEGKKLKEWQRSHNWHAHQLRHNAATTLRKEFGLDVAQVVLGHKTLAVTQVYAERDIESAAKVMMIVG